MHSWERLVRRTLDTGTVWVLSVQHTGTWFVLDLLREHPGFPSVDPVTLDPIATRFQQFGTIRNGDIVSRGIIHGHVGHGPAAHFSDSRKFVEGNKYVELTNLIPIITPLRDPLAAMITRHARHPMLDARYIVDAFVWLAHADATPTFLRVDAPEGVDRAESLKDALGSVGLDWAAPIALRWAETWPVRNVSGDTWLKEAYRVGDPEPIAREMPDEWARLIARRDVLRPFLERFGYRNLLWW